MCADFLLQAVDGGVVIGRSMELVKDLASQVLIGGRGTQTPSPAPDSGTGLNWTGQYGDIGLNALDQPLITDGMNGLSIGALSPADIVVRASLEPIAMVPARSREPGGASASERSGPH